MKPGINLMIAMPTYTRHPHLGTCMSLFQTARYLTEQQISHRLVPAPGFSMVVLARNFLVDQMLQGDFSHMLMVDDDIGWRDPSSVLRLVAHDVDVVGGAYPIRAGTHYALECVRAVPGSPLLACNWIGTGFLCLSRRCLLKMANDAPTTGMPFAPRMVFDTRYVDGRYHTEDVDFCHRWRAMGGTVHVDSTVELMHFYGEGCHEKPYREALAEGAVSVLPAEGAEKLQSANIPRSAPAA